MKLFYLTTYFLLASLFATSQTKTSPRITKGYYSISSDKSVISTGVRLPADTGLPAGPAKGYYSIQQDSANRRTTSGWLLPKRARPVITKGYYSIGDHIQRFPRQGK